MLLGISRQGRGNGGEEKKEVVETRKPNRTRSAGRFWLGYWENQCHHEQH